MVHSGIEVTVKLINFKFEQNEQKYRFIFKVLKRSEMLEYYEEVSGCYIIRPLAYNIWQEIQSKAY